jgi:hypothetical protein
MTATVCPQCGQVLSPLAQDPATVIVPPDDQDVSQAAEQTPPDSATAIFGPEDEVPAAEEPVSAPAEIPRDAPTAILPPEEEVAVTTDEEAPGAEAISGPEAPVSAVEERPLPPELTPLEGVEPTPPAEHTPPGGMTTPFPPEEIEAEARLPYEDTDRSETPPVAITQPRLHEPAPGPQEVTTPHHLRIEPPPRTPPPPRR